MSFLVGAGMSLLGSALGSIVGKKKNKVNYFDPRNPQQISLDENTMTNLSSILGGGGFTGNMKKTLRDTIQSSADEGLSQGISYIDSIGLDPKSAQWMKGLLARDRARAIAKGGLTIDNAAINNYMQALGMSGNMAFAKPPMLVSSTTGKDGSFMSNFGNNLGGILGYVGGKKMVG